MKIKKIIIGLFLLTTCFLGLMSIVQPTLALETDIEYTFVDDNLYPYNDSIDFDTSFNIRTKHGLTQDYPATYSFENGFPDSFTVDDTGLHNCSIVNIDNHDSVLQLYDYDNIEYTYFSIDTNLNHNFTIEFWWRFNCDEPYGEYMRLQFRESTKTGIYLSFNYGSIGRITYSDYTHTTIEIISGLNINTWYHIQLYVDIDTDHFNFTLNNELIASGLTFYDTITSVDNIYCRTRGDGGFDYYHWLDAIGINVDGGYNYTFYNNPIGYPLNWDCDGYTYIVKDKYNRDYCIELYNDTPDMDMPYLQPSQNRTISFDILKPDIAVEGATFIEVNSYHLPFETTIMDVCFRYDGLYYYSGGWNAIITGFMSAEIWYNMTFVFDDTNYLIDIYVDGSLEYNDYPYENNYGVGISDIEIDAGNTFYVYFDNFYISGTDYINGSNIFPLAYTTYQNKYETEAWEFAIIDINTLNPTGTGNPLGWSMSDYNGGSIQVSTNGNYDRRISMITYNENDQCILERTGMTWNTEYMRVNSKVVNTYREGNDYAFNIEHKSYDGTVILNLMIIGSELTYYDGSGYKFLRNDITTNEVYNFDVWFDYFTDTFTLDFYVDGYCINRSVYTLPYLNKAGLSSVKYNLLTTLPTDHSQTWFVDSCQIGYHFYGNDANGYELGFTTFDLDTSLDLSMEHFPNVHIRAYGEFWMSACSGTFASIGQTIRTFRKTGWNNYYNTLYHINNYNYHVANVSNPTMIFWLKGSNFNITTFEIDGVKLKNSTTIIPLEYSDDNLDDTDGYFQVDSSNRLTYTIITDDNDLEFINATFDIINVNSNTSAFGYRSYRETIFGYAQVNYNDDTTTLVELNEYLSSRYITLPSAKFIDEFCFIISDIDDNSLKSTYTGYFTNIRLLYYVNIGVTIVTTQLINLFVPLIIMFVPTLAVYKKYGGKTIIPIFMLMALICVITQIIPTWLFVMICIALALFVFTKRKYENGGLS